MLWRANALKGYGVLAADGRIGEVSDFLVDDTTWNIRWFVGELGDWKSSHKVLLPPVAFDAPREEARLCPTSLTMARVSRGLDIARDPPISVQMARDSSGALGLDLLADMAVESPFGTLFSSAGEAADTPQSSQRYDSHLRSLAEVAGYKIHANDGAFGEVEDFVLDEGRWHLTHFIVRWSSWWNSHRVLIPVAFTREIDWRERRVRLSLSRSEIKSSLPCDHLKIRGGCGADVPQTAWGCMM